MESTRVVKVAVSGDDDNVLPNKFCISQVAEQAVWKGLELNVKGNLG